MDKKEEDRWKEENQRKIESMSRAELEKAQAELFERFGDYFLYLKKSLFI